MAASDIEYALMVKWDGDFAPEYIRASDLIHARLMARTLYANQACVLVGRTPAPWCVVRADDDALTGELAF